MAQDIQQDEELAQLARERCQESVGLAFRQAGINLGDQSFDITDFKTLPFNGLDLSEFLLMKGNFTGCKMNQCFFINADCTRAIFISCELSFAVFDSAMCVNSHFGKAVCVGASFVGADLASANLIEAKLMCAQLGKANLVNANLTGANLRGAILTGAILTGTFGADFTQVTYNNIVNPGPDLPGAETTKLSGATTRKTIQDMIDVTAAMERDQRAKAAATEANALSSAEIESIATQAAATFSADTQAAATTTTTPSAFQQELDSIEVQAEELQRDFIAFLQSQQASAVTQPGQASAAGPSSAGKAPEVPSGHTDRIVDIIDTLSDNIRAHAEAIKSCVNGEIGTAAGSSSIRTAARPNPTKVSAAMARIVEFSVAAASLSTDLFAISRGRAEAMPVNTGPDNSGDPSGAGPVDAGSAQAAREGSLDNQSNAGNSTLNDGSSNAGNGTKKKPNGKTKKKGKKGVKSSGAQSSSAANGTASARGTTSASGTTAAYSTAPPAFNASPPSPVPTSPSSTGATISSNTAADNTSTLPWKDQGAVLGRMSNGDMSVIGWKKLTDEELAVYANIDFPTSGVENLSAYLMMKSLVERTHYNCSEEVAVAFLNINDGEMFHAYNELVQYVPPEPRQPRVVLRRR